MQYCTIHQRDVLQAWALHTYEYPTWQLSEASYEMSCSTEKTSFGSRYYQHTTVTYANYGRQDMQVQRQTSETVGCICVNVTLSSVAERRLVVDVQELRGHRENFLQHLHLGNEELKGMIGMKGRVKE